MQCVWMVKDATTRKLRRCRKTVFSNNNKCYLHKRNRSRNNRSGHRSSMRGG